jgi:hypothetical protein
VCRPAEALGEQGGGRNRDGMKKPPVGVC